MVVPREVSHSVPETSQISGGIRNILVQWEFFVQSFLFSGSEGLSNVQVLIRLDDAPGRSGIREA